MKKTKKLIAMLLTLLMLLSILPVAAFAEDNVIEVTASPGAPVTGNVTLAVGEAATIRITNSSSMTNDFTISVSNKDVASVSQDAITIKWKNTADITVTALAAGTARISIKGNLSKNNPSTYVDVTVKGPCAHENTTIINAVEATCIAAGYSGDTYCNDCETTIATGKATAIDPDKHCGEAFLDETTVVAATCIAAGYTGDTICEACKAVLEAGEATAIDPDNHACEAELDENSVVAATCVAQGYSGDKRCSECGEVVEEGTATDIDPDNHATEGRTPVEAQEATCQHVGWDAYEECTCREKLGYNEYPQLDHSYTGDVRDNGDMTHSFKCVNGCNEYGGTVDCVDEKDGDGICDICGATLDPYAQERADAIAKLKALAEGVEDETVQKMLASYVDQIGKATSVSAINRIVSTATSALKQQIEIANEGAFVGMVRAFVNLFDGNNQRTTTKVMGIIKPILGFFGIK